MLLPCQSITWSISSWRTLFFFWWMVEALFAFHMDCYNFYKGSVNGSNFWLFLYNFLVFCFIFLLFFYSFLHFFYIIFIILCIFSMWGNFVERKILKYYNKQTFFKIYLIIAVTFSISKLLFIRLSLYHIRLNNKRYLLML